ncbi:MAG: hypothetical protein ACE5GN_06305, partial [Waddliaceae bacterium]
ELDNLPSEPPGFSHGEVQAEAIGFMQAKYGSLPADLLVGISPSLGPQSAEFINYRQEFPEPFWEISR